MPPARFLEPWKLLEMDFQDIGVILPIRKKYLLLIVGKALRFLFVYPTKTSRAITVATNPDVYS